MKINSTSNLKALVALVTTVFCSAQKGQEIRFDFKDWVFEGENYVITEFKGENALEVKEDGFVFAYLKDSKFKNGIIEFKMALSEKRNFPAINFRIIDNENFENFYLRPHQSGNPDALQYTPVYKGLAAWQLYHGPKYTKDIDFDFDKWIDIRMVVQGSQAEVYFNGESTPSFFIPRLHRDIVYGMVGFAGDQGYYADFKYTIDDNVRLKGKYKQNGQLDGNTISKWWISKTAFDEVKMMESDEVPEVLSSKASWTSIDVDENGLLNISRVHRLEEDNNLVFVKFNISSSYQKNQKFVFGFNDRVKVFVNGKPMYYGDNTFRSRDYRFLGSIGFFDTIYLPLKKGENEVVIAVAESFGGWGIKGKLTN